MKASFILCIAILIAAALTATLPSHAAGFLRRGQSSGPSGSAWNANYYDPAWGMPEALVVPPTVRWQSNYAWGVGGSRLDRVGAQFQFQTPGPESSYNQRDYFPAPPQPSDTLQFGVYSVRGPRP